MYAVKYSYIAQWTSPTSFYSKGLAEIESDLDFFLDCLSDDTTHLTSTSQVVIVIDS